MAPQSLPQACGCPDCLAFREAETDLRYIQACKCHSCTQRMIAVKAMHEAQVKGGRYDCPR